MRKIIGTGLSGCAIALAAVMHWPWFALDVVGRISTMMDSPDTFERVIDWLAAHPRLASEIAPWILFVIAATSLFVIHSAPLITVMKRIRPTKDNRDSNGGIWANPAQANTKHDAIEILIGDTSNFDELQRTGRRRHRILRVGVHNRGNGYLSNCSLSISLVLPNSRNKGETTVPLQEGFSLGKGQIQYIKVATYDETVEEGGRGAYIQIYQEANRRIHRDMLNIAVPFTLGVPFKCHIILEATTTEAGGPQRLECSLVVAGDMYNPRFRIEKA